MIFKTNRMTKCMRVESLLSRSTRLTLYKKEEDLTYPQGQ